MAIEDNTTALNELIAAAEALPDAVTLDHRTTFRGNNLGTEVTTEQLAAIHNGSFTDLWLGDYWENESTGVWRIVDFDYWYKTGDTTERLCTDHHVVIMPDKRLTNYYMNPTAVNTGGYDNSELYSLLGQMTYSWFDNSPFSSVEFLAHREYFVTETYSSSDAEYKYGKPTNGAWRSSSVELPNELMIYGCNIRGWPDFTVSKTQLALFRARPEYIMGDGSYWLRDTAYMSLQHFVNVQGTGLATYSNANVSIGVRPVFAICCSNDPYEGDPT